MPRLVQTADGRFRQYNTVNEDRLLLLIDCLKENYGWTQDEFALELHCSVNRFRQFYYQLDGQWDWRRWEKLER